MSYRRKKRTSSIHFTFDDVLLLVEGLDGQLRGVETGKAVDEVGAGRRVNVPNPKVEGFLPVDGPGPVVTHNLVIPRGVAFKY